MNASNKQRELKLHIMAANHIIGKKSVVQESSDIKSKTYIKLVNKCKELKEALDNNTDIEHIGKLLDEKRCLSIDFENLTGIKWRL